MNVDLPLARRADMEARRKRLMGLFFKIPKEPKTAGEIKPQPISRQFNELKRETGLTAAGLNKILLELAKKGFLKKVKAPNGRPMWMPTDTATDIEQENILEIENTLEGLKKQQALYWHAGDLFGYYKFGFSTDLMSDKLLANHLLFNVAKSMEEHAFKTIADSIKNNDIIMSKTENGKVLLAVEIDWDKFAETFKKLKCFIGDINNGTDAFLDGRLDFKELEDKFDYFYFLVRFTSFFADEPSKRKLSTYLKRFSGSYKFYEITKVNPKLFDEFIECIDAGRDPLKNKDIEQLMADEVSWHDNNIDRYIKAARIFKYNNPAFIKKLDKFEFTRSGIKGSK